MTALIPRTHKMVLFQGDDEARLAELRQATALAVANEPKKPSGPRTLDDTGYEDALEAARERSNALAVEHDALLEEATERAVTVVLCALGRKSWHSLVEAHPPREDNESDKAVGVNEKTFPDALVPPSMVEPKFDTPAERDRFLDDLSDAQFQSLYSAAFYLNRGVAAAPKALSSPSPSSSETKS